MIRGVLYSRRMEDTCKINDCSQPRKARGLCNKHWYRQYRYGDVSYVCFIRGNDQERFWSKVKKSEGCWTWLGYSNRRGYGQVILQGKVIGAHRAAWSLSGKELPKFKLGLSLDHLCKNKLCVRPDHLEVVTTAENTLRSDNICMQNKAKTQCKNGHMFTQENTVIRRSGHRDCRACLRIRSSRFYYKHISPRRFR